MFDVKKVQAEAEKEVQEDQIKAAKTKIKTKIKEIAQAKSIVRNLEREYDVLLVEIGDDVS